MACRTTHDLAKSARFHVRATHRQAQLIRAGAQRKGLKLTDYIIDSLCAQSSRKRSGMLSLGNWIGPPKCLPA
jgi:hypothetical protein